MSPPLKVLLFFTLLSIIVSLTIVAGADKDDDNEDAGGDVDIVINDKDNTAVTYDGRSLIINGKRSLLFSGSVHYPRSTPEVCSFFIK